MRMEARAGRTILTMGLLAAAACGGGEGEPPPRASLAETATAAEAGAEEARTASEGALPVVTVYKSPTCGCCAKWVEHMRAAGFEVEVVDDAERLYEAKRRHAIGPGHTSCHTAEVGDYFVEGHVPAADVARLLAEAPADVKGLAVPGMPVGSPGMEGTPEEAYDVVAIKPSGETGVYASH